MAEELMNQKSAKSIENRYISEGRLQDPLTGLRFSHRFYRDKTGKAKVILKPQLEKTIERLSTYGGLLQYIDSKFDDNGNVAEDNWIRLLAASLNWLTYEKDEANDRRIYEYALEKGFLPKKGPIKISEIRNIKVPGTKRLWAAVRDYIVDPYLRRLFMKALKENNPLRKYLEKLDTNPLFWEKYMEQLELPGDQWNDALRDYIYEFKNKMPKGIILSSSTRSTARRLYLYFKQTQMEEISKLYPLYLDATFLIRGRDLQLLFRKGEEIMNIIEKEVEDLNSKGTIVKAYQILIY